MKANDRGRDPTMDTQKKRETQVDDHEAGRMNNLKMYIMMKEPWTTNLMKPKHIKVKKIWDITEEDPQTLIMEEEEAEEEVEAEEEAKDVIT